MIDTILLIDIPLGLEIKCSLKEFMLKYTIYISVKTF